MLTPWRRSICRHFTRYAKGGPRNQPFHQAMMVKVLLYGNASGVFSSRKLAKRQHDDVAFRVLAAGNFPAHRTLSDFRALHLAELSALFVQVVKLSRECGLVKLGTIAVDGTKMKVNASRHKAMSYGRMVQAEAELKQQIATLLECARATGAAEANKPEQDLPAEIARREQLLVAIEAAKERLEAQQREAGMRATSASRGIRTEATGGASRSNATSVCQKTVFKSIARRCIWRLDDTLRARFVASCLCHASTIDGANSGLLNFYVSSISREAPCSFGSVVAGVRIRLRLFIFERIDVRKDPLHSQFS